MNIATLFFAVWLVDDLHGSNTMVAIGNGVSIDGLLPSYGTGIAYRAGVVTVAIGMIAALAILWAVPDKWRPKSAA